jgi:cardiolipin synthase (CMP-forming)
MTALTAANQLTLLRMLLIPVLALLVLYDRMGWALVVLVLAALTDLLDGYLARRDGPTTLGAWLDPVADKLLIATMFVLLTLPLPQLVQRVPLWLTVLVMSRDIGIVVTVAIVNLAVGHRTFPPSIFGKAATATFMLTAVLTLWANYVNEPMFLVDLCAYASLALTVISALHYAAYITGFVGVSGPTPPRASS